MARTSALLNALITIGKRRGQSLLSFSTNNIFYAGFALLFFQDPQAFTASAAVLLLVLFLPLSADPLQHLPSERVAIWPLTQRDIWAIRIARLVLNPAAWILAAFLIWRKLSLTLWLLLAVAAAISFAASHLRRRGRRFRLPNLRRTPNPTPNLSLQSPAHAPWPMPFRHTRLIRKNIRALIATLDFYAAALLALSAAIARLAGVLPPDAFLPCVVVIMLLISTCALSLFGLEGSGAFVRYRLLPIKAWEILAAKDAAFAIICLALTAALLPTAGLAAILVAVALGHRHSIQRRTTDRRWRFQTSDSFIASITQMTGIACAAVASEHWRWATLLVCAIFYVLSLRSASRLLDDRLTTR